MAVYYKFKSAKDYHSIQVDGPFISIFQLKERIFNSKLLGKGKDFDLVITNAQTNEEYLDEEMLIPRNISVLIRRVPGPPCKPIVTQPEVKNQVESDQPAKSNLAATDASGVIDYEASKWDNEFGIYPTISETSSGKSNSSVPSSKSDEDDKIKALVESSGFGWQNHHTDRFGPGRIGGRGGHGSGGLACKTPPEGYVCHRCKVPGHFIQHCPTNGDRNYDIKKVRPPTGVPKSMLVPSQDGSYVLPSGTAAVLQPNEAAFEKEMEGLSSTRSYENLPPELHCPLCKEVMRDAVLTSKCCFESFCDKCIRDNIITKSMCVCGARGILADDLLPNKTLRETINRILESGSSSSDKSGNALRAQDVESARCPQPRNLSPTLSAASKGDQMAPTLSAASKGTTNDNVDGRKPCDTPQQQVQPQTSGDGKITKVSDVSEATHETATVKESDSALPAEKGPQKVAVLEAGKKKKRKKVPCPANAADMEWIGMQSCMNGYMDPSAFPPCWPGMQPAMNGFMGPYGGNVPYSMGYGSGPYFSLDPYGTQGFMMPNMRPPPQSNNLPENRDYDRVANSDASVPPVQLKHKQALAHRSTSEERYNDYHNHDHDNRREHKRSSLNHEKDHDHSSHRSSDRTSHWSADRTSHHSDVSHRTLKRKFQHHELDLEKDQSHYYHHSRSKSSSFSNCQPSEVAPASSRISSLGEHSKKRRQECVLLVN